MGMEIKSFSIAKFQIKMMFELGIWFVYTDNHLTKQTFVFCDFVPASEFFDSQVSLFLNI